VHLLIDLCDGGDLLSGVARALTTDDSFDEDEPPPPPPASDPDDPECAGECWKPFSEAAAAPAIRSMLRQGGY